MANPVRVRTATGWQDLAIQGAQGPTGVQGAQGAQGAQGPTGPTGPSATAPFPGDTKISLQPATHADPAGGMWLLADGSAIPGQYTALIALAGATLPDAKGRTLVMLGTHTDVNAVGKNDGKTLANRRPKHGTAVWASPGGGGGIGAAMDFSLSGAIQQPQKKYLPADSDLYASTENGIVSLPTTEPLNAPAYVVIGNLFIHT